MMIDEVEKKKSPVAHVCINFFDSLKFRLEYTYTQHTMKILSISTIT